MNEIYDYISVELVIQLGGKWENISIWPIRWEELVSGHISNYEKFY